MDTLVFKTGKIKLFKIIGISLLFTIVLLLFSIEALQNQSYSFSYFEMLGAFVGFAFICIPMLMIAKTNDGSGLFKKGFGSRIVKVLSITILGTVLVYAILGGLGFYILGLLLFGLGGAVFTYKSFKVDKPLVLSSEGILCFGPRFKSYYFIWNEVSEIRFIEMHLGSTPSHVMINVLPKIPLSDLDPLEKITLLDFESPVVHDISMYKLDPSTIVRLVTGYVKEVAPTILVTSNVVAKSFK